MQSLPIEQIDTNIRILDFLDDESTSSSQKIDSDINFSNRVKNHSALPQSSSRQIIKIQQKYKSDLESESESDSENEEEEYNVWGETNMEKIMDLDSLKFRISGQEDPKIYDNVTFLHLYKARSSQFKTNSQNLTNLECFSSAAKLLFQPHQKQQLDYIYQFFQHDNIDYQALEQCQLQPDEEIQSTNSSFIINDSTNNEHTNMLSSINSHLTYQQQEQLKDHSKPLITPRQQKNQNQQQQQQQQNSLKYLQNSTQFNKIQQLVKIQYNKQTTDMSKSYQQPTQKSTLFQERYQQFKFDEKQPLKVQQCFDSRQNSLEKDKQFQQNYKVLNFSKKNCSTNNKQNNTTINGNQAKKNNNNKGLAQSQDCQTTPEQTFNLLQDEQLKKYAPGGTLFIGSLDDVIWWPNLPQPKQNTLLRFKLQAHTDNEFYLFDPQPYQPFGDEKEAYFNLEFQGINLQLDFNYDDQYQGLNVNLDDQFYDQPEWLTIFFQKNYISVSYKDRLLKQIKLNHPELNYLTMFTSFVSQFGYYDIFSADEGSVQISDLQVFNDLTEQQSKCFLGNNNSEFLN